MFVVGLFENGNFLLTYKININLGFCLILSLQYKRIINDD